MEDEIGSIAAIIGASLAGVKSMTATSGPGFSLMQENIGYAAMTEVPVVIVNVQRGGPSTGLPTLPSQADVMQARWGTHGDHPVIAVVPSTVYETYVWTIKAFNFSEQYRVPVIVLLDEIIAHINEKITIPAHDEFAIIDRTLTSQPHESYLPYKNTRSGIPSFAGFGTGYRYHVTGLCHDETGFPSSNARIVEELYLRLNRKIDQHRKDIIEYQTIDLDDAEICIVAYGSSARSAQRAVRIARKSGIKVGLFKPFVLWPFPGEELAELTRKAKTIIVPEMNLGQIAHEVSCATRKDVVPVNRVDGTLITPQEIVKRIQDVQV
jgi:2-oxoglutarate ferredoxin oxidoreductase subunit alpha